MQIRFARKKDYKAIYNMWKACFHDTDAYMDMYFSKLYRPENTLVLEEGGTVASSLQMLPYNVRYNGKTLPACYISGAATLPSYRMRGFMAKLLYASFEIMKERGIKLSTLIPFNFSFYEKFGYSHLFSYKEEKVHIDSIRPAAGMVQELTKEDMPAVKKLYNTFIQNEGVFLERPDNMWECIFILYGQMDEDQYL